MTVFIPSPITVCGANWDNLAAQNGVIVVRYADLCALAGIPVRVSSDDVDRDVLIIPSGHHARRARDPSVLAVHLVPYHGTRADALRVLEVLAYGFNDYAAREAVCGKGLFIPAPPPGRPRSGKALSSAEKMRRHRERQRQFESDCSVARR